MTPILKKLRAPLGQPMFYLVVLLSLSLVGLSCLGEHERDNPLDPKYAGAATATPGTQPTNTPPPPPGWIDRAQYDDTVNNNEIIIDTARYPGAKAGSSSGWWVVTEMGKEQTMCVSPCAGKCATFMDYVTPGCPGTTQVGGNLRFAIDVCTSATAQRLRCILAATVTGIWLDVSNYTGIEAWWSQMPADTATMRWGLNEQNLTPHPLVEATYNAIPTTWQKKQVPFTTLHGSWGGGPARKVDYIQFEVKNDPYATVYLDEIRFY